MLNSRYKKKKSVIYGAGEFSKEIFETHDLSDWNIVAVADLKFKNSCCNEFYGCKCIAPEEIKNYDFDIILVANRDFDYFKKIIQELLGKKVKVAPLLKPQRSFSNMFFGFLYYLWNPTVFFNRLNLSNKIKTQIFGYQVLRTAKSVGKGFWCGGFSIVNTKTVLANNVSFGGMKIMGIGGVKIGQHFHSGIDCLIITSNHNYDGDETIPYGKNDISRDVEIGDFVWLGSRVTILPGTKIGEGAIIQGGSVVHGEIPPYAIAGGNPAKVFKYRDVEHFEKLKAEGKFY